MIINPKEFVIASVDDSPMVLRLIEAILEPLGYTVNAFTAGAAFLNSLEKPDCKKPDMILLDVMMPGLSGFEVAAKLQGDDNLAEIPIIYLTARTDIETIRECFSTGGVDHIGKPFQNDELVMRINNHLKSVQKTRLILESYRQKQYNREKYQTQIAQLQDEVAKLKEELEKSRKQ